MRASDLETALGLRPDPFPKTNCTAYSVSYPGWRVSDFEESPGGVSGVRFELANLATGVNVSCSGTAGCVAADDSETRTTFVFDEGSRDLEITQSWVCDDSPATRYVRSGW